MNLLKIRIKNGKSQNLAVAVNAVEYKVIEHANGTYTSRDKADYMLRSDAEFDIFAGIVLMDGKEVDAQNYTAEAGSTKITFKAAYMESLGAGTHKVAIISKDGFAATNLTVKAVESKADSKAAGDNGATKTGDSSNIAIWISAFGIAVLLIALLTAILLRKRRSMR